MLRFEDVARVASSMKLVLEKRQHTDSDGIGNNADTDDDGVKNCIDLDDDGDGVTDSSDSCQKGNLHWTSNTSYDNDADGCLDIPLTLSTQQLITNGTVLLSEKLSDDAVAFAGHFNWPSMTAGKFRVSYN